MIFGVGINDVSCTDPSYSCWHSIHRRAYSDVYHKTKPSYIGTEVSEEWHLLSNFKRWFDENYVEGWAIDKDLLSETKPGKLYSQSTCCFLPSQINSAIMYEKANTALPGVYFKKANQKYVAQLNVLENGKRKNLHLLIHDCPYTCFEVYKQAKEKYVRGLANQFQLPSRVKDALLSYQVNC